MSFTFDPLPKGFFLSKPVAQENYDEQVIYDLEKRGDLIITRKRDGWKLYATVNGHDVRLFTAGLLNEVDNRLAGIKMDLARLNLHGNNLLVGEAHLNVNDQDDIGRVISILQTKNEADAIQLHRQLGWIRFTIFGVVFFDNQLVVDEPYLKILRIIQRNLRTWEKHPFLRSVQVVDATFDKAKRMVVEKGWEGLVLYDREFRQEFRVDGKAPKRPKGCYKWKPILEDDFIVTDLILRPNPEAVFHKGSVK